MNGESPPLILVVDDDPTIRQTVSDVLVEEGPYRVVQAGNGQEALDLLESEAPALVLLDMRMPVLDGWAFARHMRARGLEIPIVVMSAATDAAQYAADVDAVGYLSKPFDLDGALATVARALAPAPSGC